MTDGTRDAMNNPIVLGQAYGYTSTSSGFTYVRIGIAVKVLPGSVTLATQHVFLSSYGDSEDREEDSGYSRKVNVRGINVFPVNLALVSMPAEHAEEEAEEEEEETEDL